jgi:transposase InsO family protein
LGKSQSLSTQFHAFGFHTPHGQKTLQKIEMFPDGLLEWVDWFNNRRLLAPIGYIPPAEAEERYYASLDQPAMAA